MRFYIIILLLAAAIASCQKDHSSNASPSDVAITITSPTAAQLFHNGDTIHMLATVSYPDELHGYELKITDSNTSVILFDTAQHVHADRFSIDYKWICKDTIAHTMKLQLTTEIDHNGTEAEKTVYFKYQP